MANWIENALLFTGDPSAKQQIKSLFIALETQQEATGRWHVPEFVTVEDYAMLDISVGDENIYCRTRWRPNLLLFKEIADHFGAGFIARYEDPLTYFFAASIYENGSLIPVYLEYDDVDKVSYNREADAYSFEDRMYEDEFDAYSAALTRKIEAVFNAVPGSSIGR